MQRTEVRSLDQEIFAIICKEYADRGVYETALTMLGRRVCWYTWSDGRSSVFYLHCGVKIQIGFLGNGAYEACWVCS